MRPLKPGRQEKRRDWKSKGFTSRCKEAAEDRDATGPIGYGVMRSILKLWSGGQVRRLIEGIRLVVRVQGGNHRKGGPKLL